MSKQIAPPPPDSREFHIPSSTFARRMSVWCGRRTCAERPYSALAEERSGRRLALCLFSAPLDPLGSCKLLSTFGYPKSQGKCETVPDGSGPLGTEGKRLVVVGRDGGGCAPIPVEVNEPFKTPFPHGDTAPPCAPTPTLVQIRTVVGTHVQVRPQTYVCTVCTFEAHSS